MGGLIHWLSVGLLTSWNANDYVHVLQPICLWCIILCCVIPVIFVFFLLLHCVVTSVCAVHRLNTHIVVVWSSNDSAYTMRVVWSSHDSAYTMRVHVEVTGYAPKSAWTSA